jgi:hypothetical protein
MSNPFDTGVPVAAGNVTQVTVGKGDFVYVQLKYPGEEECGLSREDYRIRCNKFFQWVFGDEGVKFTCDYPELKFTVLTKKEEFVARLNDDVVQL